jgi:hypothetical protein
MIIRSALAVLINVQHAAPVVDLVGRGLVVHEGVGGLADCYGCAGADDLRSLRGAAVVGVGPEDYLAVGAFGVIWGRGCGGG